MKKLTLALFGIFLTLSSGLWAAAPQAVLQSLKGKVEVKLAGTKTWTPATEGQTLALSATLSTGFDSSAVVVMGKSSVQVKPLTRMTIDKLVEEGGTVKTSTFLRVGSVSVSVKSAEGLKSDFQVQSPYSTASVRGTKFDYDGLHLKVLEGTVAFIPGRPHRETQPGAPAPANGAAPSDDFVGAPNVTADPTKAVPVPAGQGLVLQVGFNGAPPKPVGSNDAGTLQQQAAPPPLPPPPPPPVQKPASSNGSINITIIINQPAP